MRISSRTGRALGEFTSNRSTKLPLREVEAMEVDLKVLNAAIRAGLDQQKTLQTQMAATEGQISDLEQSIEAKKSYFLGSQKVENDANQCNDFGDADWQKGKQANAFDSEGALVKMLKKKMSNLQEVFLAKNRKLSECQTTIEFTKLKELELFVSEQARFLGKLRGVAVEPRGVSELGNTVCRAGGIAASVAQEGIAGRQKTEDEHGLGLDLSGRLDNSLVDLEPRLSGKLSDGGRQDTENTENRGDSKPLAAQTKPKRIYSGVKKLNGRQFSQSKNLSHLQNNSGIDNSSKVSQGASQSLARPKSHPPIGFPQDDRLFLANHIRLDVIRSRNAALVTLLQSLTAENQHFSELKRSLKSELNAQKRKIATLEVQLNDRRSTQDYCESKLTHQSFLNYQRTFTNNIAWANQGKVKRENPAGGKTEALGGGDSGAGGAAQTTEAVAGQ